MSNHKSLATRLLSGASWAFLAKSSGMAAGLAVNVLLARLLSPAEFGAYLLLSTVVTFGAAAAQCVARQAIVRVVAEAIAKGARGRAGKVIVRSILLSILGGGVFALVFQWTGAGQWLLGSVFDMPMLRGVTVSAAVWIFLLTLLSPIVEAFRGLQNIRVAVMLDGVSASLLLAGGLAVVWSFGIQLDLARGVYLSLGAVLASVLIGSGMLVSRRGMLMGEGSVTSLEILRVSAPLYVVNVMNQALAGSSLWLAGGLLIPEDVALFGVSWKLVMLIALPLTLINMSIQPIISELYFTGSVDKLQKALRGMATLSALPSLAVVVLFAVSGGDLLSTFFGETYRAAAPVLIILTLGQLVNAWTGSCGMVLAFTGHQSQLMRVTFGTGVLAVAAMFVGGYWFGIIGIAIGATAGRIAQNAIAWWVVKRLTGLATHATLNASFAREALSYVRRRR